MGKFSNNKGNSGSKKISDINNKSSKEDKNKSSKEYKKRSYMLSAKNIKRLDELQFKDKMGQVNLELDDKDKQVQLSDIVNEAIKQYYERVVNQAENKEKDEVVEGQTRIEC